MPSTRERIIHAALTLIGERGLGGVTMVAVAHAAGIARQTLYNHYPDVGDIVADAIRQHNADSIAQLRRALGVVDTPTAKIEQLIRHIAAISSHANHTLDAHYGLPPDVRALLDEYDHELDQHIRRALVAGAETGAFRADLDVDIDAALIRHLLTGVSKLVAETPGSAAEIVVAATRTTLAALT